MYQRVAIVVAGVLTTLSAALATPSLRYVASSTGRDVVVVDTRNTAACSKESWQGARCLPAEDFIAPDGRLANFRGILWLLGTAGLSGTETVLVSGDRPLRRDFVAGVLFLAGQRQVQILRAPLSALLAADAVPGGPGRERGILRSPIYVAQLRDRALILPGELQQLVTEGRSPVIVNARADDGACSRPSGLDAAKRERVVYAPDALHAIACFTQLRAAGEEVLAYPGGLLNLPIATSNSTSVDALPTRMRHGHGDVALLLVVGGGLTAVFLILARKAKRWTLCT